MYYIILYHIMLCYVIHITLHFKLYYQQLHLTYWCNLARY